MTDGCVCLVSMKYKTKFGGTLMKHGRAETRSKTYISMLPKIYESQWENKGWVKGKEKDECRVSWSKASYEVGGSQMKRD